MKDHNPAGWLVSVRTVLDAGGVVPDPGWPDDDLSAGPGAAAYGSAPEGGTVSSASAMVPLGRLAPRRPRTGRRRPALRIGLPTDDLESCSHQPKASAEAVLGLRL